MINLYPLYIRVHGPRSYHLGFRAASGDVEYLFRFSDDDDNMVDYIDTGFNDATIVDEAKFFIYQTVFSFHAARQSSILKGARVKNCTQLKSDILERDRRRCLISVPAFLMSQIQNTPI